MEYYLVIKKTEDKNIWLIYENISLNLLQTLANKLDLNWEEKKRMYDVIGAYQRLEKFISYILKVLFLSGIKV